MYTPHYIGSHLQRVQLLRTRVITARKRSLGQRNISTGVCHFFCPRRGGGGGRIGFPACISGHMTRGVCLQGGFARGGWAPPQDTCDTKGYSQQAGGTHSSGMHSYYEYISLHQNNCQLSISLKQAIFFQRLNIFLILFSNHKQVYILT